MISIKNEQGIRCMRDAGKIVAETLAGIESHITPGVTTKQLDTLIRKTIESHGAKPSFLGYNGFPASACISLNDEVIHGIPSSNARLCDGDIVKVDVGALFKGYHGDAARTFFCGNVTDEAKKLAEVTKQCFFEAIKTALPNNRIGDISSAVQTYAESFGYSVVREFVGHGIGEHLHEDPEVPNYGRAGRGVRLCSGMTVAVEPMINAGRKEVGISDNEWTVFTADGKLSAHYENTVLITDNGPEILTLLN